MGYFLKSSSTAKPLLFLMIDSTDHLSGKTGLTPTVTISKNGAAFAAPAGAVTELANGWYKCAGNATDTDTLGPLVLHATASGADPVDDTFTVVAYDPDDTVRAGLTALPNAVANAANGLITNGSASGQLNVNSGVAQANIGQVAGFAAPATSLGSWLSGFEENTAQGGGASTITLAAAASATDNIYNGRQVNIISNTGFRQTRVIVSYDGATRVATVDRPWAVNPDATSNYSMASLVAPRMDAGLKVTPADVDGITFASAMEALLAVIAGKATVTGSDISFLRRDGTTSKITVTVGGTPGVRTASVINS